MSYKKRFAAFFFIMTVFNLAASFAHPVTPTIIQDLGLHDYMFGLALAAMMLTNFLVSPFWGKINTYIGSRTSLLISCLGYGIAQLWFAYADSELMIVLARMFAGLFTGGAFVSFLTYIVNKADPVDQGRYLTYAATIKSVGGAFGYLVGGFLGEISVRLSFLAQAGLLMASGAFFFFICLPDGLGSLRDVSGKQLAREANPFKAFIDSREFMTYGFLLLFLVNIFTNFGNTGFDQAFNYYLKDEMGLSSSYNGIVKAFVGLVSFAANMSLCIWIINRTRVQWSMAAIVLVCVLTSVGVTVSHNTVIFIIMSVILYAGYSVSVPVLQSMIAGKADPKEKNLVMGFFNATQSLGSIAGSLTAGFVYSTHPRLPFLCVLVVYGLGLAASLIYARRRVD